MNIAFCATLATPVIAYFGMWFLARDTKKMIERNRIEKRNGPVQLDLINIHDHFPMRQDSEMPPS